MSNEEAVVCLVFAVVLGLISGWGFGFVAGDSKPRMRKSLGVGVFSGMVGWGFGLVLPINEYKSLGVVGLALIFSLWGCHIYWAVFKSKSKIVKELDTPPHGQRPQSVSR